MPATVKGTLYTYPDNFRAAKILIAAQYSGAEVKIADNFVFGKTNKTKDFVTKFPTGKVPAFESDDGLCLSQSNAIAYHVANDQLRCGSSSQEADKQKLSSSIMEWLSFAEHDLEPAVAAYCFPLLGITSGPVSGQDKAECNRLFSILDKHLANRSHLVGDSISLADICIASVLLLPCQFVCDAASRKPYGNLTTWFTSITTEPQFVKAIGEVKLCEEAPVAPSAKGQEKSTKKKEQQAKQKKASESEERAEELAKPTPSKDPFGELPKGNWDMDDFKRFYSNNEEAKSIPYFFEKFDKDNFSVWHCEYDYSQDLVKDFMSSNLIRGMFQRLDRMRKHAFGSMCLFGADKDATISGVWVWRGQGLAFDLSEDLQIDSPSYTWTKLDYDKPETKKKIEDYFKWQGVDHAGRPFNQGKIFK